MQEKSLYKNIFKRELTIGMLYWMLINLISLCGVWFYNWDAKIIFLVYCLESVIIGIYTLIKIFLTSLYKRQTEWRFKNGNKTMLLGIFFMLFFTFHFGMFIFIQLSIFLGVANFGNNIGISVLKLFLNPSKFLPNYALLLIILLFVTHGLILIKDYIISQEYKTAKIPALMFEPYSRIIIQQIVIILAAITLLFDKNGKILMLIFIVIKIIIDNFIDYKKIIAKAETQTKNKIE